MKKWDKKKINTKNYIKKQKEIKRIFKIEELYKYKINKMTILMIINMQLLIIKLKKKWVKINILYIVLVKEKL